MALPATDLCLAEGEILALMGPSGSGKTTLLDCVLGTRLPTSGRVTVLGVDLGGRSPSEVSRLRRRSIGIVAQNPQLLPELSVVENVAVALLFNGVPRRRALARGQAVLEEVGLSDAMTKRPGHLSGGEAQRVALARALAQDDVRLLVADEPTAALDEASVIATTDLLVGTARTRGVSVVVATHDRAVAARCDRVQMLRHGSLMTPS
ncbi:ABC transporter ATP-binding protein [Isoptericola sp. NEAU-Y5]|uniref:ABC transporter ATP-binding protein n=1 Tax=Isoptericola luteus TaxID=2879484 RepID=A0ABS7ZK40_9MICO|nr:ABC transporter ATP-binding protein [Isoptericola sp. NEAU-Y5]MCA5894214.1 ABC transporter ATP-binding protein [Isoptericola sp. NEAU-Y5]